MKRPVRAVLLLAPLLLTLGLSAALRDTTPPELWIQVPERVAAAEPFELFASADEPVTFEIRYGELRLEEVAQDLTASLLALPGSSRLEVVAIDGAGNETTVSYQIEGVRPPALSLQAPEVVAAGDPVTALLAWQDNGSRLTDVSLSLAGAAGSLLNQDDALVLIAAVPFEVPAGSLQLMGSVEDDLGRITRIEKSIDVLPGAEPIEQLNISPATLSVITPEGRLLEQEALAAAYAQALPVPQWQEPFQLPLEGRSTSGFASARRYAPGGPASYHEGSDLAAPTGTPIHATNDGVVRIAGDYPIKGGLVVIDHGMNVFSLYMHQSRILVNEGDVVSRGAVIGEVGSTGLSTGPHLHWEMRVAGEPTNPLAWVDEVWP